MYWLRDFEVHLWCGAMTLYSPGMIKRTVSTVAMFGNLLTAVLFVGAVAAKGAACMPLRRCVASARSGVPVLGNVMTEVLVMGNVAVQVVVHVIVICAGQAVALFLILGKEVRLLLDTLSSALPILSYLHRAVECEE